MMSATFRGALERFRLNTFGKCFPVSDGGKVNFKKQACSQSGGKPVLIYHIMLIFNTKNTWIVFLWMLGATQCRTQSAPVIAGTIQMSSDWKPMVYLVQPRSFAEIASNYSGLVLDSASVAADGSFAFPKAPKMDGDLLVQLCIQKAGNRFPNQLLDDNPLISNYMPLVLKQGQALEIRAEAHRFQASFFIQNPSAENRALLELRDIRLRAYQAEQVFLNAENPADEHQLLEQEAALHRFQKPLMDFADSSAGFWPALVATRWVSLTGDYERIPEFIFRQCEMWRAKLPETAWAKQLCQAGNREKLPVMVGDQIPDFVLPMSSGDTLNLHALLGKRLSILDIWASWCMPCRRENREVLAPIWAKYKDQGLQILGYSIDSSPAAWKAAIAKDLATWPHASHLSGDETPFLQTLRISTIPANFILDADGKVVAKNLHGEALEAFLEAYFK